MEASKYTEQIKARSMDNLKALGIRRSPLVKQGIQLFAELGAEVKNVARDAQNFPCMEIEFVDETEFWTEQDFEEHRAECHMTREEYYGA